MQLEQEKHVAELTEKAEEQLTELAEKTSQLDSYMEQIEHLKAESSEYISSKFWYNCSSVLHKLKY